MQINVAIMKKFLYSTMLSSLAFAPQAEAFELGMPIKCDYGTECFIQNYYDEDSEKGDKSYRDYSCGKLSYDGHDGTDFRIRDYEAMQKGVDVIASAAGTVFNVRDSMDDINVKIVGKENIMKQGCGNAVVLQHPGGFRTMYCHMKKGSVAVKKGDTVEKGQKLGQVGLSGLTEFPHVHLSVIKDGKKIDPFTGGQSLEGCRKEETVLWDAETKEKLAYIPTGLLKSSFSDAIPQPEAAREGKFNGDKIAHDAGKLILWADVFGLQPNDILTLTIASPDKKVLIDKSFDIKSNKAVFFQYIGLNKKEKPWPKGDYLGKIQLKRGDKLVVDEHRTMTVF